ncbi:PEP-utilizing enzyme [Nocardia crassostreae]|uniref:PEP-utilizing enzyme n=1 Tax=Nocardia crassostreae TaxID=53428 RepID=UPI000831EE80|nr:PEP-utilizing enzyme [Nocardia crassostreae]
MGRLTAALPELSRRICERVDTDLAEVPRLEDLSNDTLLDLPHHSTTALTSLHGYEALAGVLDHDRRPAPTAAAMALTALAEARAAGVPVGRMIEEYPVLLALTPPRIGGGTTETLTAAADHDITARTSGTPEIAARSATAPGVPIGQPSWHRRLDADRVTAEITGDTAAGLADQNDSADERPDGKGSRPRNGEAAAAITPSEDKTTDAAASREIDTAGGRSRDGDRQPLDGRSWLIAARMSSAEANEASPDNALLNGNHDSLAAPERTSLAAGDAGIVGGQVDAAAPASARPQMQQSRFGLSRMGFAEAVDQEGYGELAVLREALRLRARWVQELSARAAAELGRRLADRGVLEDATDVTLLRFAELRAAVVRWVLPADLGDRRGIEAVSLPTMFRLSAEGVPVAALRSGGAMTQGVGAGGGTGRGIVHMGDRPPMGSVLVVRHLDPRLAAVVPGLGGLVAETGSPLSHLAILAREHGVPTVVGFPEATRRLPDGAMVEVDGRTGEVRVVPESEGGLS